MFLGSTIIVLAVLIIIMWTNINMRKDVENKLRDSEKQLKQSLKEKEIMLSEIHHRVKNNMQVISSLVALQAGMVKDEYDYRLFIECQNRIKSMALVHEKLYHTENLSHINLQEYIEELVNEIISIEEVDTKKIKVKITVEEILLDLDRTILCGLIINELISNAYKYAFPDGEEGDISISFEKEVDIYRLIVEDTGIGMEEKEVSNISQGNTLGLQLIESLVLQLHGTKIFSGSRGVYVAISFPV
jgi:two-component sensor histidine kinase